MAPDADSFTLADLCDLAAVTPRTVRFYIAQGLLRSPSGAGPGARYDAGHLARLRLIRRLQRDHLPLAEIRRRLAALADADAIALAEEPTPPPSGTALDYIRSALTSRGVAAAPSAPSPPPQPEPSPQPLPRPSPPPAHAPQLMRRIEMTVPAALVTAADAEPALADPSRAAESRATYAAAPDSVERSQWERIVLDPDIEVHVRRPLSRAHSRAVDRLVQAARRILKEDLP